MMDGVFQKDYIVDSRMVDIHSRVMPSQLFFLLQDVALSHCRAIDLGRDKTTDKGFLWVVTQQTVHVDRMPSDEEQVTVLTWPGPSRHMFMPRYTEILDNSGKTVVSASACWMLMDAATRKAVYAKEAGITLPEVTTGRETPFLNRLMSLPLTEEFTFTVPYSYCDLNGHMNNSKYFDLACDHAPEAADGKQATLLQAEYKSEVHLGESLLVKYGADNGAYYFTGAVGERDCFRLCIRF